MAIFGIDSLMKRVNWVKVEKWCVENVPRMVLTGVVVHKLGEVLKHAIDSHKETVKYMTDKAAETGSYVHASHDGDYTFDARRGGAPEKVEGKLADADAPEAIPEAV